VARLVQVAAVEPQGLLLGRLPHVAQLAFPGAGVLGVSEPRPQHLPTLSATSCEISFGRPAVHRAVAGGVDDEIGGQLGAVLQHHAGLGQMVDLAARQLDLAVGDQLGLAPTSM
jgi:hypothetical protein